MRTLIGCALVMASAGTAAAEVEQVPPAAAVSHPITVGAAAAVWFPSGDADDFANTSIGIRPNASYRIKPWIAAVGSFDWIFVDEKSGVGDITYYSVSLGARLMKELPNHFEPYGELLLGYHKLEGEGVDDSGIGFRIGGGANYPLGSLVLNAGLSYSAVSIDTGFVDVDVDALVIDVGLGARF